jgi:hypothetical protein
MEVETVGLLNTGLPLAIMAMLAVLIPLRIVPRETRSQGQVFGAIATSAVLLALAGFALWVLVFTVRGAPIFGAFMHAPGVIGAILLRRSLMLAIIWVPVLALVWLSLAQRVEKRKGEDLTR